MPDWTYHEIDFQISVKEGFYHYQQKVSPAYRVGNLPDLDWASIVVHRLPGHFRVDQWFVSEQTTGSSIEIPKRHRGTQPSNTRLPESSGWARNATRKR